VQETLPYPSVHLVCERGKTQIVGVDTGKFSRLLEGEGRVVAAKFTPGGFYPFVNVPVCAFTNRTASLEEIFGVDSAALEALEETIFSCPDEAAMVACLESFLGERLPAHDAKLDTIQQIIASIIAHPEITSVTDLAVRFDMNKRSLQRLFRQYVGVGPKWVIKRYRLHEVAERLAAGERMDWQRIVWELGYTDQAHFIHDFQSIVGQTPTQYAQQAQGAAATAMRS
jgi:AraC-like DNA-binding protein